MVSGIIPGMMKTTTKKIELSDIYQKDDDITNPINHVITTILFFLLSYKIIFSIKL